MHAQVCAPKHTAAPLRQSEGQRKEDGKEEAGNDKEQSNYIRSNSSSLLSYAAEPDCNTGGQTARARKTLLTGRQGSVVEVEGRG